MERPASVVKELLENSLDAGAANVRVEIEAGGRRLIRIVDDGCGMLRDDALLAFERHATSKLRDVKDLLSISTLGFRGEALPSIASVSRLLLETRAAEETTGTRIEIAGGKMLRCEEAALGGGTVITVRDLFYNVPARRKFLRTEPTELAHVASLVTHYSLAHPEKTFLLTSGPTELLHVTPVATMKERVYQVFGSQVLDELVEIGAREREMFIPPPSVPASEALAEYRREPCADDDPPTRLFRLSGFFSRPQVQKGNRNSIGILLRVRRRDEGLVRDRHVVVLLVALVQALQDLDRLGEGGLVDLDRLEAALEGGVLLEVLAVLVEGGRADRLQLAPGEHRLQDRGRVDGPEAPAPTSVCSSSMKRIVSPRVRISFSTFFRRSSKSPR